MKRCVVMGLLLAIAIGYVVGAARQGEARAEIVEIPERDIIVDGPMAHEELACVLELAQSAGFGPVVRVVKTRGPAYADVATSRLYEREILVGGGRVKRRVLYVGRRGTWRGDSAPSAVCRQWWIASEPQVEILIRSVVKGVVVDLLPVSSVVTPEEASLLVSLLALNGDSLEFWRLLSNNGWAHVRRLEGPPSPSFTKVDGHEGRGHDVYEVIAEKDYYLDKLSEFLCIEGDEVVRLGAARSTHSHLLSAESSAVPVPPAK